MYLRSLTKRHDIKENLNPIINLSKKNHATNEYFLTNERGIYHRVCRSFLLKCLNVSASALCRSIKSVITNEACIDKRGCFPTRKTNRNDIAFLKTFIAKFPTYESHYTNKCSNKKYLDPQLNIRRMFREYKTLCEFERRKTLSEWVFRKVFNTDKWVCEFNLNFHRPIKDSCKKCDNFEIVLKSEGITYEKQQNVIFLKNIHLYTAEYIRKELKESVQNCRNSVLKTEIFTFDLQRVLEVPSIKTNEAYYRRQLWVFNLCIYDEIRNIPYMYIWNESIASRGAQEVGSCICHHLAHNIPKDTKKIILYSDACGGQNRNIKIALMLKKFIADIKLPDLETIEQRFFLSGHSFNNCDRNFGLIERQRKVTENVFIPNHWVNIIQQAKKNDPKFNIIQMQQEHFYSTEFLESIVTNRKITVDGEKVCWFNFQSISHERQNPFTLKIKEYSTDNTNETKNISIRKRNNSNTFESTPFGSLYNGQREISKEKYNDLLQLLKYVPERYHSFFKELNHCKCNSSVSDHPNVEEE